MSSPALIARQLDHRNAQLGTIGGDFKRFGIEFWVLVNAANADSAARQRQLPAPTAWRNAIAHHDIESRRDELTPHEVTLATCRSWRSALDGLAQTFDQVLAKHLETLVGARPW